MDLSAKQQRLEESLRMLGRTLVAYSGGVDSAYLAWIAHQVLGNGMLAVIADSPSLARTQLKDALAFAGEHQIPIEAIQTAEMDRPEYIRNDRQRCYHCKDELFQVMQKFAEERGYQSIAYGVNVDDQSDFRPGQTAARQHQVAAPLLQAGLGKAEIRELARNAGLRVWEKPASACLSSRIEYGRPVTLQALSAVEQGEEALHALTPQMFAEFTRVFKGLGFAFVALDTEGFRSGSMNTSVPSQPLIKLIS